LSSIYHFFFRKIENFFLKKAKKKQADSWQNRPKNAQTSEKLYYINKKHQKPAQTCIILRKKTPSSTFFLPRPREKINKKLYLTPANFRFSCYHFPCLLFEGRIPKAPPPASSGKPARGRYAKGLDKI